MMLIIKQLNKIKQGLSRSMDPIRQFHLLSLSWLQVNLSTYQWSQIFPQGNLLALNCTAGVSLIRLYSFKFYLRNSNYRHEPLWKEHVQELKCTWILALINGFKIGRFLPLVLISQFCLSLSLIHTHACASALSWTQVIYYLSVRKQFELLIEKNIWNLTSQPLDYLLCVQQAANAQSPHSYFKNIIC